MVYLISSIGVTYLILDGRCRLSPQTLCVVGGMINFFLKGPSCVRVFLVHHPTLRRVG